jgi:hypothetical protein
VREETNNMPSRPTIVGRAPGDDDPVVRDGEIVRVPLLLRDGSTVDLGGGLMMSDGTSLGDRIANLSPEMRRALGLPTIHIEDGRGGVAGHRPGFAYSPQQLNDRARPRADDPRRRAFEDYQRRLTEAWRNP